MRGGRDCLGEGLVSFDDCVGVVGSGWLGLLRV
jgi:hypothetical protein